MAGKGASVRDVINEIVALASENGGYLALVTAAVAAGYVVMDLLMQDGGYGISSLVVGILVQFLVVERLLGDRLPAGKARRRYGAMFVSAILGGLGIIVGFLFLIVPGVLLAAGWSASTPFIVVEEKGGVEALGASWEATEGSRLALALVVFVGGAALLIAFVLVMALSTFLSAGGLDAWIASDQLGLVEIILSNIFASGFSVAGWLLGAAVYRLVRPMGGELQDVFA